MKRIDKDELYESMRGFLASKGVSIEEGSYTQCIRQGCNLLTDAINTTQDTVARAKIETDKKLEQLRQSIHEATAPKPPPVQPAPEPAAASGLAPSQKKRKPRRVGTLKQRGTGARRPKSAQRK